MKETVPAVMGFLIYNLQFSVFWIKETNLKLTWEVNEWNKYKNTSFVWDRMGWPHLVCSNVAAGCFSHGFEI